MLVANPLKKSKTSNTKNYGEKDMIGLLKKNIF